MTDARERLEAAIRDVLVNVSVGTSLVQQIADAVERALAPEPPAPLKVWPGLEGEGLDRVREVFDTAYDNAAVAGKRGEYAVQVARTAQAGYLFRALVASLPVLPDVAGLAGCVSVAGHYIPREALAALADPYDGGGKGVGQ